MSEFKVIVAGSRTFGNFKLLCEKLDNILANKTNVTIISGMANGADMLGVKYAEMRKLKILKMPADWNTHGLKAGYLRNMEMAKASNALVAFWDGKSKGTNHMIAIAKELNLPTRIIRYDNE